MPFPKKDLTEQNLIVPEKTYKYHIIQMPDTSGLTTIPKGYFPNAFSTLTVLGHQSPLQEACSSG